MKTTKKSARAAFRQATMDDVEKLVTLEQSVWGDNGADEGKIISRIRVFPAGNVIAELDGAVVGYISFEYVGDVASMRDFSWAEITDNGTIVKSHLPDGEYIYGINLSVHHSMNGMELGTALPMQVWINMILNNKRGSFVGSRIPGFGRYKRSHPETEVKDYIELRRKGKPRDYELRLYAQEGLLPVKILPNYFPDPPSLNYGVLIYRKNPFYNWPFRKFWAWVISKIIPTFIRGNIAVKKEG
jgi:hypothetical protein